MATQGSILITTNSTAFSIFLPSHAGPKSAGRKLRKQLDRINAAVLEDKADMVQIVNINDPITPDHKTRLKHSTRNSTRCRKYDKWTEHLHGNLSEVLDSGVYVDIDPFLDDSGVEWVYHVDIPRKRVSTIKNESNASYITEEYGIGTAH